MKVIIPISSSQHIFYTICRHIGELEWGMAQPPISPGPLPESSPDRFRVCLGQESGTGLVSLHFIFVHFEIAQLKG